MISFLKGFFNPEKEVSYHCDFCFKEMSADTMVVKVQNDVIHASKECVSGLWRNTRFPLPHDKAKKLKEVLK